jgi:hypothetical protein
VLTGGAVVVRPAFAGASITHVAAAAAHTQEDNMKCTKCGQQHAAGVEACATAAPEFNATEAMAKIEQLSADLAAMKDVRIPVGPGTQEFHVVEEPIYRFAGSEPAPSGHDFAMDLLKAAQGDGAALKRVQDFTSANVRPDLAPDVRRPEFAVKTTDVTPTQGQSKYRADMFLGNAPVPASPLYDTFYKGALNDVTPFFWSKFDRVNSTAGISDHVEGVEPADKTIKTLVGTTVTPSAVSGRVHITRETADQGGNPVASGLVWAEFDRSYKIALETKTSTLLKASLGSVTTLATIATATTDPVLRKAILAGLIGLQFDPQGFRFSRGFGHVDLYTALALMENNDGTPVFPVIGASNRNGEAADKFAHLNVAGYDLFPAASLGASGAGQNASVLADPIAVHVWNSGLQRLDKLQEDVEGWDLGCFGYFAGVVYDTDGLRQIKYTK